MTVAQAIIMTATMGNENKSEYLCCSSASYPIQVRGRITKEVTKEGRGRSGVADIRQSSGGVPALLVYWRRSEGDGRERVTVCVSRRTRWNA
jgi:hypothetical protein